MLGSLVPARDLLNAVSLLQANLNGARLLGPLLAAPFLNVGGGVGAFLVAAALSALALWDYCERSARFVFGNSLGDPTADELLRALQGALSGLTRNEIREHFGRNKSAAEISRALGVLVRQGLARSEMEKQDGPGRPTERWHAVRPGGV